MQSLFSQRPLPCEAYHCCSFQCFSSFQGLPFHASISCALQTTSDTCTQGYKGALHNAHLETIMSASGNVTTCIKQQICQPLGGHSIWAAAPPLAPNADSSPSQLPIIMLLAPVDSDSLFRSATVVSMHKNWQLHCHTCHICMHAWVKAEWLLCIPVT